MDIYIFLRIEFTVGKKLFVRRKCRKQSAVVLLGNQHDGLSAKRIVHHRAVGFENPRRKYDHYQKEHEKTEQSSEKSGKFLH